MKKLLTITGIILLSSCTVERTVVVEPATTTESPVPPTTKVVVSASQREREFINFMVTTQGIFPENHDLAIEVGYQVCGMADDGASAQDFVDLMVQLNPTMPELIAAIIAGALQFLCPEHQFLLSELDGAV